MRFDSTARNPLGTKKRQAATRPAGFWLRFIAYSIDSSIVALASYFLSKILFAGSISFANYVTSFLNQLLLPLAPQTGGSFVGLMIGIVVAFAGIIVIGFFGGLIYATLFEGSSLQATPGKLIVGLKVSNTSQQPLSMLGAFGRNFAKLLSYLTLFIGFLMAAFSPRKQALHDYAAGALVVRSANISWMRIILSIIIMIALSKVQQHFMPEDEGSSIPMNRNQLSTINPNPWTSQLKSAVFPKSSDSSVIKYVDDNGRTHYVTQVESVPEEYRDKAIEDAELPEIQRFSEWGPKPKKRPDESKSN